MKNVIATILGFGLFALPAFALAQSAGASAGVTTNITVGPAAGTSTGVQATGKARVQTMLEPRINSVLTNARDRAAQEIQRRIGNLNKFQSRVADAKHINSDDQASISATISAQVDALTTLGTQIAGDDSTTTLRADIQSITKSYRIYALVLPQSAITAAADRVNTVAVQMTTLIGKIQDRAASSTVDVSASLSDASAKIADAQAQASAAVSEVSALKPDNGDQTIMASNTAALKDARTKIQAAQQDIVAARKDIGTALSALGVKASAGASASTTASASLGASVIRAIRTWFK